MLSHSTAVIIVPCQCPFQRTSSEFLFAAGSPPGARVGFINWFLWSCTDLESPKKILILNDKLTKAEIPR